RYRSRALARSVGANAALAADSAAMARSERKSVCVRDSIVRGVRLQADLGGTPCANRTARARSGSSRTDNYLNDRPFRLMLRTPTAANARTRAAGDPTEASPRRGLCNAKWHTSVSFTCWLAPTVSASL